MPSLKIPGLPKWVLNTLGISNSLAATFRPQLLEGVVPVVQIGSYEGYDPMFIKRSKQAASAAVFNHAQLWNPTGAAKNVYAVVRRCRVKLGAAGALDIRVASAFVGNSQGQGMNRRAPLITSDSVVLVGNTTNAALQGSSALDTGATNGPLNLGTVETELQQVVGWRIEPGFGLIIANWTLNELLEVIFEWDEYPL